MGTVTRTVPGTLGWGDLCHDGPGRAAARGSRCGYHGGVEDGRVVVGVGDFHNGGGSVGQTIALLVRSLDDQRVVGSGLQAKITAVRAGMGSAFSPSSGGIACLLFHPSPATVFTAGADACRRPCCPPKGLAVHPLPGLGRAGGPATSPAPIPNGLGAADTPKAGDSDPGIASPQTSQDPGSPASPALRSKSHRGAAAWSPRMRRGRPPPGPAPCR